MKNKYNYYLIIQEFYESWTDVDTHEANALFQAKNKEHFKANLRAYKENSPTSVRSINRREKV